MKAIELIDKLRQKPVFTIQDIERLSYCNKEYAKQILIRLKKRKLIREIRRNAYTTKDNIYVIASNITYPSYISFWSASSFQGYTEQILNTVQIATTAPRIKPIIFERYTIKFIPIKQFFGYRKMKTDDGELFIAENEKLIIDALLKPEELGNFDEIIKIIENAEISSEKMTAYLKKTASQTLIKRVGYLLEKTKSIDLSKNFSLDKNYITLNPFREKWKTTDRKWRVRI